MPEAISLKPEDLGVGGGGILADTNLRIDKIYFGMEDYGGKSEGGAVVALKIEYTDLDTGLSSDPNSGKKYQQSWSTGAKHNCTPSPDGKQLVADPPVVFPKQSSNYGIFMISLGNAIGGEELSQHIGNDITVLTGMECHMFQQPDDRPNAKERVDQATGRKYPATIPVIDHVMVKPWDKKGGTTTVSVATPDGKELKTKAMELIKQVLKDSPNGLARPDVTTAVFNLVDDNNLKVELATLISNDDAFVSSIEGVTFENNVLKLA